VIKKFILNLAVLVPILFASSSSLVLAATGNGININSACSQNYTAGSPSSSAFCQDTSPAPLTGSGSVGNRIINLIAAISGFVAVIIIIIAGIQYMTSGGDPQKINKAKDTILFAAIGIIVVVLARIIIYFIVGTTS